MESYPPRRHEQVTTENKLLSRHRGVTSAQQSFYPAEKQQTTPNLPAENSSLYTKRFINAKSLTPLSF